MEWRRGSSFENCVLWIFVHNHPSGDPEASEDDIKLTKRLAEAGEIMGIDVLDHIIIGDKNYLSLKREALFWKYKPPNKFSAVNSTPAFYGALTPSSDIAMDCSVL